MGASSLDDRYGPDPRVGPDRMYRWANTGPCMDLFAPGVEVFGACGGESEEGVGRGGREGGREGAMCVWRVRAGSPHCTHNVAGAKLPKRARQLRTCGLPRSHRGGSLPDTKARPSLLPSYPRSGCRPLPGRRPCCLHVCFRHVHGGAARGGRGVSVPAGRLATRVAISLSWSPGIPGIPGILQCTPCLCACWVLLLQAAAPTPHVPGCSLSPHAHGMPRMVNTSCRFTYGRMTLRTPPPAVLHKGCNM